MFFRVNVNWPIGVNGVYVLFTFLCFVCSVPESESQFSPDPCAGLTLSPSSDSGLVSVQKFFLVLPFIISYLMLSVYCEYVVNILFYLFV